MKKKKLVSMILATTIVSGTMLGKNLIVKANSLTKEKESKATERLPEIMDFREVIIHRVDHLEKCLNEKDYDLDSWIKRTNAMIDSLSDSDDDKEIKNRYNALKQRYEKEKKSGDNTGRINKLKIQINDFLSLANEDINNKIYSVALGKIRLAKEKIKELSKYEDISEYTKKTDTLEKNIFHKQIDEREEKEKEQRMKETIIKKEILESEEKEQRMKETIIKNINSLEEDLNSKNYKDVEWLINQIKFRINKFNEKYKLDTKIQEKFNLLEQKYLTEKPVDNSATIKKLKTQMKNLINLGNEELKNKQYGETKEYIKLVEARINDLKKYEDVTKETYDKLDKLKNDLAIKEKESISTTIPEVKEVKTKETKMKEIIEKNVEDLKNLLDNKEYSKAKSMIKRIDLEKSKLKESIGENKELDKKVEELQNRYEDEKVKVVPAETKSIKEDTRKLIDSLSNQVKSKDIIEAKKTIDSVEKKVEELKKYKKVNDVESTLKDIKSDLQNGKEIDSSKLAILTEQLDKSINSEDTSENIQNEAIENMNEEEKALFNNNEDTLKTNEKDLLEKEEKENKKSLAVKVGAGIGAILLGAGAFLMNKRFRKKH